MKKNQKGLTLIEMMIAMVIGLLLVGTVLTIFITNVRSNRDNVSMLRLNQELRGAMTFVSDELRRTGYSEASSDSFINLLKITDTDSDNIADDDCVLYGYDAGGASTVPATNEQLGFRRLSDTIYWGSNVTTCTFSSTPVTEPNIATITSFQIKLVETDASAGGVVVDTVEVTITGQTQLSGGVTATRTITENIRVRNDKV